MYISACLAYDDVKGRISPLRDSLAIQLVGKRESEISLTLHPMQCKVLGEALLNAANQFPIEPLCDLESGITGSLEVEFMLEKEEKQDQRSHEEQKGELACRPENLSVRTDSESLPKIA